LCTKTNLGFLKVLVVDNYDSFTYNLVDYLRSLQVVYIEVVFNDQIDWRQVDRFHKILISPGPGTPDEAGSILQLIQRYKLSKSILGVCLGHQAIAQVFGGQLINIPKPRHGQTVSIDLSADDRLFTGLPKKIKGGRLRPLVGKGSWLCGTRFTISRECSFIRNHLRPRMV